MAYNLCMKLPFREYHLLQLLEAYDKQSYPLDLFIRNYFKDNKALGSKDRGYIAETAYKLIRWQGLLDYICDKPVSWEKRFKLLSPTFPEEYLKNQSIPLQIRYSFPKALFDLLSENYGIDKCKELCLISNIPAPTTIRANLLKTTRDNLLKKWEDIYDVSPCQFSDCGIIFHKKINFFTTSEFKDGLFEVQDEGSQLVARLVSAKPGDQVLDYCSGSGGKTLAFAPYMEGKGQIFLHDIRNFALMEGRKRLKRAGIQNAQIVKENDPKLKNLKKKMDWVLVDVPCSGTGTLRRNPDMKWNITEESIHRLVGQQRSIFEKALSFLHPEGRIIYATCSILKEENEEQKEHFIKTYDLELDGEVLKTLPSVGGMDGFFGAVLKRKV